MEENYITRRKDPDKKLYLMLFATIVATSLFTVLITTGMSSDPTGASVASVTDEQNAYATGSGGEDESSSRLTSSSTSTLPGSSHQNERIIVDAHLIYDDFQIPIKNEGLLIIAEEPLLIGTNDIELTLSDRSLEVKGFLGDLLISDTEEIILIGDVEEIVSEKTGINWKNKQDIHIKLKKGSISTVDKIHLPIIQGITSGKIDIASKLTLKPDEDPLEIEDYIGSFTASLRYRNQKVITLKGMALSVNTQNNHFSMDVE